MMFDSHKLWLILWGRAAADPSPFEIAEISGAVADSLKLDKEEATRRIQLLLGELDRLPEGEQFFALEGNAIVCMPEFAKSAKDEASALRAYPFEL